MEFLELKNIKLTKHEITDAIRYKLSITYIKSNLSNELIKQSPIKEMTCQAVQREGLRLKKVEELYLYFIG